eukprot:CAMPEP_0172531840 /NCGR_PEP_ID=MMETSP1067-20121228/5087_1 /TAXON_ID=265564 ORGANISM="Thalassiosira punctigera, Strain Tpunct2005C2" /NCGR_SAMPLE_ID=MMETSP1067 /ASSEMBLY_ACC=CAM_ASM_000444 /LENGTH=213 /DNA_ID=CAMNT_0013316271 /DNA_START=107 /DNA_END=748 /DNA_ORIENTATION=+
MKGSFFLLYLLFTDLLLVSSFRLLRDLPTVRVHGSTATRETIRLHTCLLLSQRSEDTAGNNLSIDRQSDIKYGRGISHISADLNEGDVVAYQDGTWYVDGTEVGDGSNAMVRYMQVDTIQLVWTHDCEHGVINGFNLMVAASDDVGILSSEESGAIVRKGNRFIITDDYIQVGPEQVLARIPTSSLERYWKDTCRKMLLSQVEFRPDEEILTS